MHACVANQGTLVGPDWINTGRAIFESQVAPQQLEDASDLEFLVLRILSLRRA